LRCKHCYQEKFDKEKDIPLDKTKEIVDKISLTLNDRKISVNITGGEPLLREDIFEILNYINEKENFKGKYNFAGQLKSIGDIIFVKFSQLPEKDYFGNSLSQFQNIWIKIDPASILEVRKEIVGDDIPIDPETYFSKIIHFSSMLFGFKGFNVLFPYNFKNLKESISYSLKRDARYLIIYGGDELKDGYLIVKDLKKETQFKVKKDKIIKYLQEVEDD